MNGTGRSARPVLFLSETTLTHSFELEAEDGLSLQHYEYLDRRHPDRLKDDDAAARLLCDITAGFLGAWGADDAVVLVVDEGPTVLEVSAPSAERLAYARDRLFGSRNPQGVAGVVDILMKTEPFGGLDWHNEMSGRDTERWNLLMAAQD
jgi:hypothetical protein